MKRSNHAVLALTVLGLLAGSREAPGQRLSYGVGGGSSKVGVPDDLGREPLEVAKTALGGGDIDRALSIYQDILDRLPDRVAPLRLAPRTGKETDHVLPGDTFAGLRDYVADLIRAIPDGLARYREREGPRAAADLARALAARDEGLLRKIVIRWELTESGPLALAALSDLLFQSGRVAESRLCADRLLALVAEQSAPEALKTRATLRAAVAYTALHRRNDIRALASTVASGDASVAVNWRGAPTPLIGILEELQAAVDKAPVPPPLDKTVASFAKPSWQSRPFARNDLDDETFRSLDVWVPAPASSYFPVIPVLSDSAVYFCDGIRVEGLSLLTGQPLWDPVISPEQVLQGARHWNLMHEVVLDRGVLYACLEDEPDIKSDDQHRIAGFKPRETIAVRKLYAIDANTGEIKWSHASQQGIRDPDAREFFDRISVNTPPLVIGDRLYVGATYYFGGFRQWLCAFDRETGALVWKTYIGRGQAELNMFGNPVKEVVPGYVGESNGLLVYSTNIGVVTAVDAITGSPRWVKAYEQEPVPSSDGQRTVQRPPGWTVSRPLFYGHRAIIAPSDAFDVYVFNLDTGDYRPIPGARRNQTNQLRHVVGIHDDALILAGRKVHAFDLKGLANGQDPRPKWEAPPEGALTGDASIDGRPALAGDRLFFTGRGSMSSRSRAPSYVACIDARSGRILDEKQVEGMPFRGNIVFSSDAVVVSGYELTAIFDEKEVARRLEAAIMKDPDDPSLRLRAGRIALQAKNFDRAIAELERALTLATAVGSREDSVVTAASRTLYDLILDLAVAPAEVPGLPSGPKERFEKALSYAGTPRQLVQALHRELIWAKKNAQPDVVREVGARLLAEFADERLRIDLDTAGAMPELGRGTEIKAGLLAALVGAAAQWESERYQDAIGLYQQALLRYPDDFIVGPAGAVSVWRYGYAKIAEIIKNKGAESYAAEDRAAAALLEEGKKTGNLDALRTLLDRYPNSRHVESAWIDLSRKLREAGKDREALRAVQRQLARYGTVTIALLTELERALESASAYESARDVLLSLKERFGKETIPADGGAPVPVAQYVDERLKADPFRELLEAPPVPAGTIGLKVAFTEAPTAAGDDVALVVPEGRRPKAADAMFLVHRDSELRAIDIDTGRIRWRKGARSVGEQVLPQWHDGRLLAILDGDLAALDPATGKELWRVGPLQMRVLAMHAAHGKAYLMLRPALAARSVTVRAFDIVTGEKLRDAELPLASSGEQSSLASSPLWLLCRLDAAVGSTAVLDGITGELVYSQTTGLTPLPAMLTTNDLLVTQSGSAQMTSTKDVTILARNPKTQQVVWSFKLERVSGPLNTIALNPRLAVLSARISNERNQGRRQIIVIDLETGTTRMTTDYRPSDIAQDGAVIAGDILLVKIQTPESKRLIRAYDMKKSAFLWDTVTYGGTGLVLSVHPTTNYAVVRVSSREGEKRTDTIHFFENRTGLLKDSITLENTVFRADIDIRDGALILKGGPEVSVRK